MKNDTEEQMVEVTNGLLIDNLLELLVDRSSHSVQALRGIPSTAEIVGVGLELRSGKLLLMVTSRCPADEANQSAIRLVIDDTTEQTEHQVIVEEFMRQAGQEVPDSPIVPSEDVRRLRARLTMEEALEQINALGFDPMLHGVQLTMEGIEFDHDPDKISLAQIIDGACDLRVIATGTLSACGVADQNPQDMVDFANLAKFGPGGHRREDGKWIKPADWTPPDWEAEIKRQQEWTQVDNG